MPFNVYKLNIAGNDGETFYLIQTEAMSNDLKMRYISSNFKSSGVTEINELVFQEQIRIGEVKLVEDEVEKMKVLLML